MKTTIAESSAMEALILKACGARSLTEFAKACGVSPMHISRIKSGICTPSKKMCVKLASEPYVRQIGLSAEDFMRAAGYQDNVEIESTQNFEKLVANSFDTIALGLITKILVGNGTVFQILPGVKEKVNYTLEIPKYSTNKKVYICMIAKQMIQGGGDEFNYFYSIGRLLTLEPDPEGQYVMIMNDEAAFNELEETSTSMEIRANVTIVLMDVERMRLEKEFHRGIGERYISLQVDN